MAGRATANADLTPATAVLDWYGAHRRALPWRQPPGRLANPYHVLLSEVMLQQTTVETVKPYFIRFLERWPQLTDLAAAPQYEVMKQWAGLGYYARARNLHRAAISIVEQYDGRFPDDEAALRRLPGVGEYTAAAITAFAFGQRAIVADANIERIIARYAAITTPLPKAKKEIRETLDRLIPDRHAGDFAQALMDIGRMICIPPRRKHGEPGKPRCDICPLRRGCQGRLADPASWPRKAPMAARPTRHGTVMVALSTDDRVLLVRRQQTGLLGGMDMFPTTGWPDGSRKQRHYQIEPGSLIGRLAASGFETDTLNQPVRHVFSHFELILTVLVARGIDRNQVSLPDGAFWQTLSDITDSALPGVMRKVALLAGLLPLNDENAASR